MSYLIHPPGHQSDPVHTNEQAIVNALLTAWVTGSNLPFNAGCFDATVHRILTVFRLNNQAPPTRQEPGHTALWPLTGGVFLHRPLAFLIRRRKIIPMSACKCQDGAEERALCMDSKGPPRRVERRAGAFTSEVSK